MANVVDLVRSDPKLFIYQDEDPDPKWPDKSDPEPDSDPWWPDKWDLDPKHNQETGLLE